MTHEAGSARPGVPGRALAAYCLAAYGLAWAVCLPLWLGDAPRGGRLVGIAMMATPTLATLLALRVERGALPFRRATALRGAPPGLWRWIVLAWLAVPALCVAAPFVAAALGEVRLDLAHFSGYRARLEEAGAAAAVAERGMPALVAMQLATMAVAPLLNLPFALGEEIGWRGWLLPRLLPLGQGRALVLSGAIWGLWHAPLILKGHNYPNAPELGVLWMTLFCVIWGVLLGWLRLASGSVWPAAVAHGALNGSAGVVFLLADASSPVDPLVVGVTGWTGWLLPLVAVAALWLLRRLPVAPLPGSQPAGAPEVAPAGAPGAAPAGDPRAPGVR